MSPQKCDFFDSEICVQEWYVCICFRFCFMAFSCENFSVLNESSFYLGMIIIDPIYQGEKVSEFDCRHSSSFAILFLSQLFLLSMMIKTPEKGGFDFRACSQNFRFALDCVSHLQSAKI